MKSIIDILKDKIMKKSTKQIILSLVMVVIIILNIFLFKHITVINKDPLIVVSGIIDVILLIVVDFMAIWYLITTFHDKES